jgi:hypothetical protein
MFNPSTLPSFVHQPLPHDFVRIIELHPGEFGERLKCTIGMCPKSCMGQYRCFSYVWGKPMFEHFLYCDGARLAITRNLWAGLKAVRSSKDTVRLWVDQISIDQQNLTERADQVQCMDIIFQKAIEVLVWLGTDPCDEAESTFELAEKIAGGDVSLVLTKKDRIRNLEAFRNLVQLRWFNRVWTFQEIFLASAATFYWGRSCIPWQILAEAFNVLFVYQHRFQRYYDRLEPEQVLQLSPARSSVTGSSFLDLLERTRARQASDSRDKIFALLTHPNAQLKGGGRILEANYESSVEDCFIKAAIRMILQLGDLRVLSHVTHEGMLNEDISWVPRWNEPAGASSRIWTALSPYRVWAEDRNGFSAASWDEAAISKTGTLKLMGSIVDFVTKTGRPPSLCSSKAWRLRPCKHMQQPQFGHTCIQKYLNTIITANPVNGSSDKLWHGRKLFETKLGHVGLGPRFTKRGDLLVVLIGAKVPFLLRKHGEKYRLVGECFNTNLMNIDMESMGIPLMDVHIV